MLIVGLTGSIAMGKSRVAKCLKSFGIPIFDADKAVHQLYDKGGEAVCKIASLFPNAIVNGKVDRKILSKEIVGDEEKLKLVESIIHPLVKKREKKFLARARRERRKVAVLEIPLLFETGGQKCCDKVIVVSASKVIQKLRALRRKNMTLDKFNNILDRQMSDFEKRKRADYIIRSGLHKGEITKQVRMIVDDLMGKK